MDPVWVIFATLLGLALGSFANVVIHRVPAGISIVKPVSSCPACGHGIRAKHNVPLVGWAILKGRCADCRTRIGGRYPLVELTTALAFAGIVAWQGVSVSTVLLLLLAYASIVLGLIDIDVRRLPNPIVGAYALSVAITLLLVGVVQGAWDDVGRALIGAASLGSFYGVAFLIYPRGMGFGDVKLSPVIGATLAFFGWGVLAVGAFAAFAWGAVAGLFVMRSREDRRKVSIPFGPWMFTGAWTGIFVGERVASWYLNVSGLT